MPAQLWFYIDFCSSHANPAVTFNSCCPCRQTHRTATSVSQKGSSRWQGRTHVIIVGDIIVPPGRSGGPPGAGGGGARWHLEAAVAGRGIQVHEARVVGTVVATRQVRRSGPPALPLRHVLNGEALLRTAPQYETIEGGC